MKSLFDEPERWFNFDGLNIIKRVQACFLLWLTRVVKEQLLSIQTLEDAKSRDVLLEKAPWWEFGVCRASVPFIDWRLVTLARICP